MSNTLDKLPSELLIEILSSLSRSDLKQARLSCRQLRNAGDRWLFWRIYFAPRKKTKDAFQHIAANPAFNRHIQEVIYDGRLFQQHFLEPEMYYKAYELYVREQGEEGERAILADCLKAEKEIKRDMRDINVSSRNPLEGSKRLYGLCFYIEQERILDTGIDKDVLFAGMKQMPKVNYLSIIDKFAGPDYTSGLEHSWYANESTKSFGYPLAPMRWPARYFAEIRDISDEDVRATDRPWDCRGVGNLLKAAATHNPRIDAVELGLKSSNAPMQIFEMFANDPTLIMNIARGLTGLALHLNSSWTGIDILRIPTSGEVSCLRSMVEQTKELYFLAADVALNTAQWNHVFSGRYFPHLISLHLDHLPCLDPVVLTRLLERHKASLRELKICDAELEEERGTWEYVARRLGQSLKLSYIGLGNVANYSDTGRLMYYPDGYVTLAMLFIPSYSPQEHYLNVAVNNVMIRQRSWTLDQYIAVKAQMKNLT